MRFHLIDRVDHMEPWRSVRARKLTSLSEDYWETSGGGRTMPAALVLEALCQAGTWLVVASSNGRQRATLLGVDEVRFDRAVRPGDVLEVHGAVDARNRDSAVLSGRVTAGGHTVMTANRLMCGLVDADILQPAADSDRLRAVILRVAA